MSQATIIREILEDLGVRPQDVETVCEARRRPELSPFCFRQIGGDMAIAGRRSHADIHHDIVYRAPDHANELAPPSRRNHGSEGPSVLPAAATMCGSPTRTVPAQ